MFVAMQENMDEKQSKIVKEGYNNALKASNELKKLRKSHGFFAHEARLALNNADRYMQIVLSSMQGIENDEFAGKTVKKTDPRYKKAISNIAKCEEDAWRAYNYQLQAKRAYEEDFIGKFGKGFKRDVDNLVQYANTIKNIPEDIEKKVASLKHLYAIAVSEANSAGKGKKKRLKAINNREDSYKLMAEIVRDIDEK